MLGATSAPTRGAARRATSVGTRTSVNSGPCGPCCSVEPVGTMTVSCSVRNASTCGLVISPRNTVGDFTGRSSCALSCDEGGQLADALDPDCDDVPALEMPFGADRPLEPGGRPAGDEIARTELHVLAEVRD